MDDASDIRDASGGTDASDASDVPDATSATEVASAGDVTDDAVDATDASDDEPAQVHSLLAWSLAAFHAALLVALVVGVLYLAGLAGNQLAALDTSVGVLAYLYLWGVTWWTNRRMLDAVGSGLLTGSARPSAVLAEAMKWGAAAGFLVFLPLLVLVLVLFVGAGGLEAIPFVVVGAGVGSALSAGVGVVVGGSFALLDLLLVRLAGAWLPPGEAPPARTDP